MFASASCSVHRAGLGRVLVVFAVLFASGCVTAPENPISNPDHRQLLSGEIVFGEPVSAAEQPDVDLLAVTDDMQQFVDTSLDGARLPTVKFRRMFRGLHNNGYFTATYIAASTRTAAETFQYKSGNCLSYTSMFIALAREAGLDADFQVVSVPPSWDADSGYLIRYTHVNVIIRGFAYDTEWGSDFSVDFNDVLPDPDYPRRTISDEEATSLFYANRSVQKLRAGEMRESFAYLKKAIDHSPYNSDHWINLGAFYAKHDAFEQAIQSYQVALDLDPNSRGAISGLGRANYLLGNLEAADFYNDQVRRYRERNPYFHFAIAQMAYEKADYEAALDAINTAIDLKYRTGRFHFLKGLAEYKLGDTEDAQVSFRRAGRFGNFRDLKQRYVSGVARAEPLG